jgi:hypothetical protein
VGNGSRSWVLRKTFNGVRRDWGLGSLKQLPLAEARKKAESYRAQIILGIDPGLKGRSANQPARVLTFREAAEQAHAEHVKAWRNDKHRAQWLSSLEAYCLPAHRRDDGRQD